MLIRKERAHVLANDPVNCVLQLTRKFDDTRRDKASDAR